MSAVVCCGGILSKVPNVFWR